MNRKYKTDDRGIIINEFEEETKAGPFSEGLCAKDVQRVREWFDAVQDIAPQFLNRKDYLLAKKIYEELNFRVPNTIVDGCA